MKRMTPGQYRRLPVYDDTYEAPFNTPFVLSYLFESNLSLNDGDVVFYHIKRERREGDVAVVTAEPVKIYREEKQGY